MGVGFLGDNQGGAYPHSVGSGAEGSGRGGPVG